MILYLDILTPQVVPKTPNLLSRFSNKLPRNIGSMFIQCMVWVVHSCATIPSHWENCWSECPILGFTGSWMYLPFFSVPRVLAPSLRLEIVFLVFLKDNDVLQVMCGTNQWEWQDWDGPSHSAWMLSSMCKLSTTCKCPSLRLLLPVSLTLSVVQKGTCTQSLNMRAIRELETKA